MGLTVERSGEVSGRAVLPAVGGVVACARVFWLRSLLGVGLVVGWCVPVPVFAVSVIYAGNFAADAGGVGIPDGALVQLVVSTADDVFDVPGVDSFTGGGDDLVLHETRADSFGGFFNAGVFSGLANFVLGERGVDAGDPLLVRWWPALELGAAAPGAGRVFGQFRPAGDGVVTAGSDHPWVVPGSNSANVRISMNVSFAGDVDNPEGDVGAGDLTFGRAGEVPPPRPEIEGLSLEDDTVVVRFFGVSGVTYQVERSGDLVSWAPVGEEREGGDLAVEVADGGAVGGAVFYRVVARRPLP